MSFLDKFRDKKQTAVSDQVQQIPLTQIEANTYQPRTQFTAEQITELAQSIAAHGLLQPIIVRQQSPEHYEIIAGERRFRAVSQLQWTQIPALVRTYSDQQSAALALIENLQRQDLNPIEEAQAYVHLKELNHLQQQELAQQLGKSQSYVANKIRLLKLAAPVQAAIAAGKISQRHGRALLGLSQAEQEALLPKIQERQLTVTATEKLVQAKKRPPVSPRKKIKALTSHSSRLTLNTLYDSLKLAEKSGAQFAYQEVDSPTEYQIIITVSKEDQNG
ncbi:ParB/RepB/Spo0J family partition protein [Lactobacillus sp. DCY120]|uniref:ParB/RepB/Spo0J family partition protein n=2 Tax=Bombilactobacillus apium TaxID=2675299 RepID=A0A850R7L0_9LACO|nr:ParB/RepB/Spo0J family partition protein [Bombilactobacillus apium]NVY96662.1 ParB/RepB/Spo0J family partition protein [Bombilactobacillus apium]